MAQTIRVALIQQSCSEDKQNNLTMTAETIKQADADLVVLQELHASLYFCQQESVDNFALAETIPGPTTDLLSAIAKEQNKVIVSSIFEKRHEGLYHNTAVVLDSDGSIAGKYRKMHIPEDPGFHEKFYFTPGDLGFTPIQTSIGKLGVLVCWDQWYPEAARLMALAGAELLIYPTAIGWDPSDSDEEKQRQLQAWITIQRSHAIANGVPVLSCNRIGHEAHPKKLSQGIDFWGHSFICDSLGQIMAMGVEDMASTISTTLDLEETARTRQIWPFLRDRRIDSYQDILLRMRDET